MTSIEPKIFNELKEALTFFGDLYLVDEQLNRAKLSEDLRNYNKELLSKILNIKSIQKNYIVEVSGQKIFQLEQLIEGVLYNDYWDTSYTKYENRIGLSSNGKFLQDSQDVVLDFPFKDAVLTASMTKEENENNYDEAFLNEVIEKDEIDRLFDKKILKNVQKYSDAKITSYPDSFDKDKDNLIIKGNNLLALHTISEAYNRKVKLIYIDPPYNTGSDSFSYNDKFNHSSWLTFMKNRLEIAYDLLADDGVIYVSIDDKEQAYLKVLMDSIFGRENFLTQFNIQVRYADKSLAEAKAFKPVIEYTLMYAKNADLFVPNQPTEPYTDEKFVWKINELCPGKIEVINGNKVEIFTKGQWNLEKVDPDINALKETWISGSIYSKMSYGQVYQSIIEPRVSIDGNGSLYKIYGRGEDGLGYRYYTNPLKVNANRGKMYSGMPLTRKEEIANGKAVKLLPIVNYIDFAADFGNIRHEGGVSFNNGKKPEKLLKMLFEYGSKENDIILDFFMGSGSTQATALKMGRRFIGMEQIENQWEKALTRLKNVVDGDKTGTSSEVNWQGGGSFVYAELFPKNMGYLQDIIKSTTIEELQKIYKRITENYTTAQSADIHYKADLSKIDWSEGFIKNKRLLIKILDKNSLYYNYSEIDDSDIKELLENNDYEFNKAFYEGRDNIG